HLISSVKNWDRPSGESPPDGRRLGRAANASRNPSLFRFGLGPAKLGALGRPLLAGGGAIGPPRTHVGRAMLGMRAALLVLGRANHAREASPCMPVFLKSARTIGVDVADVINFLTHLEAVARNVIVRAAEGGVCSQVRMVGSKANLVASGSQIAGDIAQCFAGIALDRVAAIAARPCALLAGVNAAGAGFKSVAHVNARRPRFQ